MTRSFLRLVARFGRDESGVFAILFGLMAIVLIALGGAVVDYVSLEQTRTRAQVALDAAALALQPEIFDEDRDLEDIKQDIQAAAEALLDDRIGDTETAGIEDVLIDVNEGTLQLRAHLMVPTVFVSLVGVQQMDARLVSEATRKKLAIEIAMVLDNSGSMLQHSRMDYLKVAAECATNILFFSEVNEGNCEPAAGAEKSEDVKIGIIPFTMYVNVGPSNANAAWIDKVGRSPLANDNFDNDDDDGTVFNGTVNRLALYDAITNDNWRGCVEARPHDITPGGITHYYDTDDTTPLPYVSPSDPGDIKSLFVPLFAPDEATGNIGDGNNYRGDSPASCNRPGSCTQKETRTGCNSSVECTGATTTSYPSFSGPVNTTQSGRYYGAYPPSCSCPSGSSWSSYSAWTRVGTTGGNNNRTYERTRTCSGSAGYTPTGLSTREYQERLCKYSGNINYTSNQKGPNADCPSAAILPLTNTVKDVTDHIKAMVADGGTNIHEGTAWGFRVLSPTEPFTQGDDYDTATSKVMIVMTDGENRTYQTNNINGSSFHSAYGYPYNNRLGTMASSNQQLLTEMDNRTKQTCANAKEQGITVYTIGLSTDEVEQSTPAAVRAMLTQCASDAGKAYFPDDPNELKDVFRAIAGQLGALRLAR